MQNNCSTSLPNRLLQNHFLPLNEKLFQKEWLDAAMELIISYPGLNIELSVLKWAHWKSILKVMPKGRFPWDADFAWSKN